MKFRRIWVDNQGQQTEGFPRLKRWSTKITSQVWLQLSTRVPTHKWYHHISPMTKSSADAIQGMRKCLYPAIKTRSRGSLRLRVSAQISQASPRRGPRRWLIRAKWTQLTQERKLESILTSHVPLRPRHGNFWAIRRNINNLKECKSSSILKDKKLGSRYSNHSGKVSSHLGPRHRRRHNSDCLYRSQMEDSLASLVRLQISMLG